MSTLILSSKFIFKNVFNRNLRNLSFSSYKNCLNVHTISKRNCHLLLYNNFEIESSSNLNLSFIQRNLSLTKFHCISNKSMNSTEIKVKSTEVKADSTEIRDLSTKEKLRKAIKEYGSTVIVFHVTISLMSLGFFYLLVSSGVDVIVILDWLGINTSKFMAGTSTFVLAYAIHKVFAPVRMGITLGATPVIVRFLRKKKFIK